jgi:hypothetical protein
MGYPDASDRWEDPRSRVRITFRRELACGAVALVCAITASARAQATGRIALSDCPPELGPAVEAALSVELSTASEGVRRGVEDGTLRCALACDEAGTTATVSRGEEHVEQRIDGHGPGLARRLAIALAELSDAISTPLPAAIVPATPAAIEEPAPPIPSDPLRARLRAAAGAWIGGEPVLPLGGFELGVEVGITNVAFVAGFSGHFGAVALEDARIDVRILSLALSARFGGSIGPAWLGGGPALRGGLVLWTGVPDEGGPGVGRDALGGWIGVGAVVAALFRLGDLPLRAGLEIEGGGIPLYSEALVGGERAQRVGAGWLEVRGVLDLALE